MSKPSKSWHDTISECAKAQFGIAHLLPVQQLVICNVVEALYAEDDCDYYERQLIVLPTGTGKSACFQVPAYLSEGTTLIVYPLISLINDQLRRMQGSGLECYKLMGGMTHDEKNALSEAIEAKRSCCILTNPESLEVKNYFEMILSASPSLIVIDEAHCISKWGKSFRSSYLNLGAHLEKMNSKVMLAFTATASDEIIQDIKTSLFLDKDTYILRGHANRENITYSNLYCIEKEFALMQLLNINSTSIFPQTLKQRQEQIDGMYPVQIDFSTLERPAIIFTRSRSQCSRLVLFLRDSLREQEIFFYHAGLNKDEKDAVERWFFESKKGILVATCAYGMGVDKSNIRTVIHYDNPTDVENFLQESGRGGRDKNPAKSIVLCDFELETINQDKDIMCRREKYLHALGIESTSCTGCDSCINATPILSPEINLVLKYVLKYPHTFNPIELKNLLSAKLKDTLENFSYINTYLIERAIEILFNEGVIVKKFLWAGKLQCDKNKLKYLKI